MTRQHGTAATNPDPLPPYQFSDQRGIILSLDGRRHAKTPRMWEPLDNRSFWGPLNSRKGEPDKCPCANCNTFKAIKEMWSATLCAACHDKEVKCGPVLGSHGVTKTESESQTKVSSQHGAATSALSEPTTTSPKSPSSPPTSDAPSKAEGWKRSGYYDDAYWIRDDLDFEVSKTERNTWYALKATTPRGGFIVPNINFDRNGEWKQDLPLDDREHPSWPALRAKLIEKQVLKEKVREFKVGDLVECLPDYAWATLSIIRNQIGGKGRIYSADTFVDDEHRINVVKIEGATFMWPVRSLRLIEDSKREFKVGDLVLCRDFPDFYPQRREAVANKTLTIEGFAMNDFGRGKEPCAQFKEIGWWWPVKELEAAP